MNHIAMDDTVRAEELGIDASEEELGVVDIRCITLKRMTIVVIEANDGLMAVGFNAPWPWQVHDAVIGKAMARQKALTGLTLMRERMATRMWKGSK